MNEADKIRMKNYEQQINMLEKENKALRKELFKYKLKDGEMTDTAKEYKKIDGGYSVEEIQKVAGIK